MKFIIHYYTENETATKTLEVDVQTETEARQRFWLLHPMGKIEMIEQEWGEAG